MLRHSTFVIPSATSSPSSRRESGRDPPGCGNRCGRFQTCGTRRGAGHRACSATRYDWNTSACGVLSQSWICSPLELLSFWSWHHDKRCLHFLLLDFALFIHHKGTKGTKKNCVSYNVGPTFRCLIPPMQSSESQEGAKLFMLLIFVSFVPSWLASLSQYPVLHTSPFFFGGRAEGHSQRSQQFA